MSVVFIYTVDCVADPFHVCDTALGQLGVSHFAG